jgi:hypothetical protein
MEATSIPAAPNPLDGPKSDYRKLTVTVPRAYYDKLIAESARRKICSAPNQLLSSLLREALAEYIEKLPG